MSQERVRGTVGLQESTGLTNRVLSSPVCIDGIETYDLSFTTYQGFRRELNYELFDKNQNLIQAWKFKERTFVATLDLSIHPDFPLLYERKFFGRRTFITPEKKHRAFMNVNGSLRSFKLDDLEFTHRDFQSHVNFTSPVGRAHQAILIATILFIPPQLNDSD